MTNTNTNTNANNSTIRTIQNRESGNGELQFTDKNLRISTRSLACKNIYKKKRRKISCNCKNLIERNQRKESEITYNTQMDLYEK